MNLCTRFTQAVLAAAVLLPCGAMSAYATTVTFNFNSLTETTGYTSSTIATPQNSSSSTLEQAIATYMNGVLQGAGCTGCTVTVTGAVVDHSYNGDGHVVGPSGTSLNLGNTENANMPGAPGANNPPSGPPTPGTNASDMFLANSADNDASGASAISIQFNGMTLNGAAGFDYEIFPDGTCTSLSSTHCGGAANGSGIYPNQPDLDFNAGSSGLSGTLSPVTSFGTNGVQYAIAPSTNTTTGTWYNQSPNSGSGTEAAPQLIGTWAGTLTNMNTLSFVDWPATIGVDNLSVSFTPPTNVPEPGSIVLFGTVVALVALRKVRKVRA